MYMKKYISKNNRKTSKRNSKKSNKKRCGCKSNIFYTMKKRIVGGNINPASFQNFETSQNQYFYNVNTHNNDPINPNLLISSRTLPNIIGGKKKRKMKNKKTLRRIKGGYSLLSPNNVLTSFGDSDGAAIGSTIITSNSIPDSSPISQPAYNYNSGSYTLYV